MEGIKIERYPSNASKEYIEARDALVKAEASIRNQIEHVTELRRQLPKGAIMKNYTFDGPNGTKVSLYDLAADGRSVVIYHFMFGENDEQPCSMCSLFADSQNGVGKHYKQLVNFAVVAKKPTAQLQEYADKRGWKNITLLSSSGNTFNKDMNVEYPKWEPSSYQAPGISVFRKDAEGNVRHVYTQLQVFDTKDSVNWGLDLLCPLHNMLDLIPEGRGTFFPGNDYVFE
jgi:predicted dithiol-disulfide oxidoreductase (DUF899 family)